MSHSTIAFIGAGNMASAIIGGLIEQGFPAAKLWAADPFSDALDRLSNQYGIQTTQDNNQAIANADVVVLAVKPQVLKQVLTPSIETIQTHKPLILSIVAGINLTAMESLLGKDAAIVRSMPNTPALVQTGATGLFANQNVSVEQKHITETLISAIGIHAWVDTEAQIDAVTAVSGSGPAYFFLVMEAMIEAGKELGLSQELAEQLTLQTALGAAKMASNSNVDAAELRKRVTSPGGTTAAALNVFEEKGLKAIFAEALGAADKRSVELADELGN